MKGWWLGKLTFLQYNLVKNPKFKVQSSNQVQMSKLRQYLTFELDLNFELMVLNLKLLAKRFLSRRIRALAKTSVFAIIHPILLLNFLFMANDLRKEHTVVLVKPDGVQRGLVGEIISRFEKAGLKLVALKMVWVDEALVAKHYPDARTELLEGMGKKTLDTYAKYGKDPKEELGTMDPLAIGKMINQWNIDFLTSGPVVAMILEGVHAIDNVRMITGNTLPAFAAPGTIRGDYSIDSPALANANRRAVHNMVHASGNPEEAKYEEELWFQEKDIQSYKRTDEEVMFGA